MEKIKSELIYTATIKRLYKLPESWIKRLGNPDEYVTNPHYRTGPKAQLFSRLRVELLIEENAEEYQKMLERSEKRRENMTVVMQKKKTDLVDWARNVPINIGSFQRRKIEEEANEYFSMCNEDFTVANRNGIVSYLRHNYTNYEILMNKIEGKVGCWAAHQIIKQRVNDILEGFYFGQV